MTNLRGRHFLKDLDFTKEELLFLLDLSKQLKAEKKERRETRRLPGRNIALIFEKTSTRTRCAFEVAAFDQGAHVTYIGPTGSQIGHKETMKDTARVLGRMYDAIEYRGFGQEIVDELAAHAGVPVYNGLTDDYHPTQMLADVLTMDAGRKAFLDAVHKAAPTVLEPIVHVEITAPGSVMGDITADLATRRARIDGNEARARGRIVVSAYVPLAEVTDYQNRLKALTGGEGSFTLQLSHYDPVPPRRQAELASAWKPAAGEE